MKTKGERRTTDMAAYLARVPPEFRHALEHLRDTIQRVAPEAEPSMCYGVPAFRFRGRPLVCFAAFKSHCGLYPLSPNVINAFADELAAFSTAKGTIRFQLTNPLSDSLVTRIVTARLAELRS